MSKTANEIQILESCAAGNHAAFESIVKQYQALICAITFSAVGQVEKSEELAHQVFINAWQKLDSLKELEKFKAWLISITRNVIRDWLRRQKRDIVAKAVSIDEAGHTPDTAPEPLHTIITKEQETIVQQSLQQIPDTYREPMVLFYRQQQSTRQVAEALDISEEAVRSRLMRGRKMLKKQVASMVESTLAQTGPGKAFTAVVLASLSKLALTGTTATAAAASATGAAVSGSSTGLAALTTGLTAKIVSAAVAVVIAAGAILGYRHLKQADQAQNQPIRSSTSVPDVNVTVPTSARPVTGMPVTASAVSPSVEPGAPPQSEISESLEAVSPQQIECMHAQLSGGNQESKIWVKGSKKWRYSAGDMERICDGKRVLVLDLRNKQASYGRGALQQPEEVVAAQMFARAISENLDPAQEQAHVNLVDWNCIVRKNPAAEAKTGEVAFDAFAADSNELVGTVWIDRQNAQFKRLEATENGEQAMWQWDYALIDDELFSTRLPQGYALEQVQYINGVVTDADANPVADATVYVTGLFEGPDQKIMIQTDKQGFFEYELKFKRDDWGFKFPVVIRAVSPSHPDQVAWTCILDPDVEVEKWPTWMPPLDPEVLVTKLELFTEDVICKSVQGLWLQLEPAGSLSGIVTNRKGAPVYDAVVRANMNLWFNVNSRKEGKVFTNGFVIAAKTDKSGYYRIGGIPSLQGDLARNGSEVKSCSVMAGANGYSPRSQQIQNAHDSGNTGITFLEEEYCDFLLSQNNLTIKGRLIDNYGNPLAHYGYLHYKEKGDNSWRPTSRLDDQGRFVMHNAPRAETILLRKETYRESYGWGRDPRTKKLEFVPYPTTEFALHIPPDVNEYDAGDLVLEYPDITAEVYVVDFAGNPIGFVDCSFQHIGSKELLKDRYCKLTDVKEGKCVFKNLPRDPSIEGDGGHFRPISLRPSKNAPKKYQDILQQYPALTYYHLKYPGDFKHYVYELVLPRNDHRQDYKMRIFTPEGEVE
jgi:RNA polymerase sigma factor (sigma-70 family)